MTPATVGAWLAAAAVGRRIPRRCIHGGCCRMCTATCGRAAPNCSNHEGTTACRPLHGCCCWARRRPRTPVGWFRHAGAGGVSDAAKTRAHGDGAGRSLAQRHVRRTSHLIVNGYERQLVRRTRSAARQGCCALGRGGARRFDWADTGQDDNKCAPCEHSRCSHRPAWGAFAKPHGPLAAARQPIFTSDAYTATGRAQSG